MQIFLRSLGERYVKHGRKALSWSTVIKARGMFVSFAQVMTSCISRKLSFIVRPGMHAVWSVCMI